MQCNTGIILRVDFSNKQKIAIYDRALGKLEFNVWSDKSRNLNLCNGMLINYVIGKDSRLLINNINIINAPFELAKLNILFLHHILELSYYFTSPGVEDVELFDLIYFLFYSFDQLENLRLQKIILVRFFLLLGFYPEDDGAKNYFYYLMSIPIDSIMAMAIDLKYEKELDLWIMKCINMHPYARSFKTKHFLNKIVAL